MEACESKSKIALAHAACDRLKTTQPLNLAFAKGRMQRFPSPRAKGQTTRPVSVETEAHASVADACHRVPDARTKVMEMTNRLLDVLVLLLVTGVTLGIWTGPSARADHGPPPGAILDQVSPPAN